MKKHFLLSVTLIMIALSAQSQIIFHEDFDGIPGSTSGGPGTYTFPNGWLLRNVDNGTPAAQVAYVNDAWERREDFKHNVVDSCMFSTSWYSSAGQSNDWAWTPAITLTSNNQLSWRAVAYDPDYPDGYEVRIMTQSSTPGGPTGGTGVIGNQITSSTVIFSTVAENSSWTPRTVDLSSYAGQTVWIGFRNNSTDKFILAIDDVTVKVTVDYDAQLNTVSLYEYSQTPISMNPSYPLSGNVSSVGAQTITDVTLTVDIYNSSNTIVHSNTSSPVNITPGSNQTFTLGDFIPVTADTYTVYYYTSMTETDQNNNNDTLISQIVVSDSVYARDKGAVTGSLGIGAGNGGYLGQQFAVTQADTLTTISMYVTRGYTGRRYSAAVWDMSGGKPNQIVAYTDTLLYPDDSARMYIMPLQSLTILSPGEYVVTAIEFDSTLALGLSNDLFTLDKSWVNWPGNPNGNWNNNEDFGANFQKAYVLRANFGSLCHDVQHTQSITLCYGEELVVGSSTYNATGNYQDIIPNGYCDSIVVTNLVVLGEITNTIDTTICFGEIYTIGTSQYTVTGVYTDVLSNGTCDSTVITNLTVLPQIDSQVSLSNDNMVFTCTPILGASYQWIDCDNGNQPILGETSNEYTTSQIVFVAVIITVGDCSDTSDCLSNNQVGISNTDISSFRLYPNPATHTLHISSSESGSYQLLNGFGQVIQTIEVNAETETKIQVDNFAKGIYFIKNMTTDEFVKVVLQ